MIGLLSNAAIHQMKNGGSKCTCRSLRYGDEWDDDHLEAEANEDFKKYFQNPFHYSHPLFQEVLPEVLASGCGVVIWSW